MDTPWLNIFSSHKVSRLQPHTVQLTSELTASKWLTIHDLLLEGLYRERGREKEARLKLYTPAISYVQVQRLSFFLTSGLCWTESSSGTASELHLCNLPGRRVGRRGQAQLESRRLFEHTVDPTHRGRHLT